MVSCKVFLVHLHQHSMDLADIQLSASSQAKLAGIKSPLRAQQFILGRVMLARAAREISGENYPVSDISEGESFPFFARAPGWHGSISHSGDWLAVTVNLQRTGLDLESCRFKPDIARLAQFALHPDEASWVNAQTEDAQERFYLLWTLREAAFKAGLRKHVIRGDSLLEDDNIKVNWHWASERAPEYRISIVSATPCTMVLIPIL